MVNGDINGDWKVTLDDVIFVLQLLDGYDPGEASPSGDVNGDERIDTKDALYMIQVIAETNAALQPVIATYEAEAAAEQAAVDALLTDMEKEFYLNGDTGPALRMPTIVFDTEGVDISVGLAAYTPAGAAQETPTAVQALLYDTADQAWAYAVNQAADTSLMTATPHADGISATWSLFADGLKSISDGAVKGLGSADPAQGMLFLVATDAGSDFLVGANGATNLSGGVAPQNNDAIQSKAGDVSSVPVTIGGCPCPTIDILPGLQAAFAPHNISISADHLGFDGDHPAFTCGEGFKVKIRLGSDLEVLESHARLGRRIGENDFRAVEPAGYFRGAAYLLVLKFWSEWNPVTGMCICQFSCRLQQVSTARILVQRHFISACGQMQTNFAPMIAEIESELGDDFFMLSDADYQGPDCSDGNPCTWDAYDMRTKACKHRPKAAAMKATCDDGDLCTVDDKCIIGVCKGTPKVCTDDGNDCTAEACDPTDGQCKAAIVADGSFCDDGDPLTENDVCLSSICQGTPITALPGVPQATGQPYFEPDVVTGSSDTTTVYIPVTADTASILIILKRIDSGADVAFTSENFLSNPTVVAIETPWIYTSAGELCVEFEVRAGNFGGAYARYTYDTSRSATHYVVYQDDTAGNTLDIVSDIPVATLPVVKPQ
jgi:hypothetical protein